MPSSKPTRYRAKAGPEVVLRKASVLFAYKLFAETSQRRNRQSRFEKGVRPFFSQYFYAESEPMGKVGDVFIFI